jgi:hypothetical protein
MFSNAYGEEQHEKKEKKAIRTKIDPSIEAIIANEEKSQSLHLNDEVSGLNAIFAIIKLAKKQAGFWAPRTQSHPLLKRIENKLNKGWLNTLDFFEILMAICTFDREQKALDNQAKAPAWIQAIFIQIRALHPALTLLIDLEFDKYENPKKLAEELNSDGYYSAKELLGDQWVKEKCKILTKSVPTESFLVVCSSLETLYENHLNATKYQTAMANILGKLNTQYDNFQLKVTLQNWIERLKEENLLTQENVDFIADSATDVDAIKEVAEALILLNKNKILNDETRDIIKNTILKHSSAKNAAKALILLKKADFLDDNTKVVIKNAVLNRSHPRLIAEILVLLKEHKPELLEKNWDFFTYNPQNKEETIFILDDESLSWPLLENLQKLIKEEDALTQQAFTILKKCCKKPIPNISTVFYQDLIKLNALILTEEQMEQVAQCVRDHQGSFHRSNLNKALDECQKTMGLTQETFEIIIQHEDENRLHIALIMKMMHLKEIDLTDNVDFLKTIEKPQLIIFFLQKINHLNPARFANNFAKVRQFHFIFSQLNIAHFTLMLLLPGAFQQEQFDEMLRRCEHHHGRIENLVLSLDGYIDNQLGLEGADNHINYAQSVHMKSVERSASKSAGKLYERYGKKVANEAILAIFEDIQTWLDTFSIKDTHPVCLMSELPSIAQHPEGMISIITPSGLFQIQNGQYELIMSPEELKKHGLGEFYTQATALTTDMSDISKSLTDQEVMLFDRVVKHLGVVKHFEGRTRTNQILIDEQAIAQRCIRRITASDYEYFDETSGISTQQLLAMVWLGLKDAVALGRCDQETAYDRFLKALHNIQRDGNITDSEDIVEKRTEGCKIDEDPLIKEDSLSCARGTFGKLVAVLDTIHPDVTIVVQSHVSASSQFPYIVSEQIALFLDGILESKGEKTCREMAKQIQTEMETDEFKFESEYWVAIKDAVEKALLEEFDILYQENKREDKHLLGLLSDGALHTVNDAPIFEETLAKYLDIKELARDLAATRAEQVNDGASGEKENKKQTKSMPALVPYDDEDKTAKGKEKETETDERENLPPLVADENEAEEIEKDQEKNKRDEPPSQSMEHLVGLWNKSSTLDDEGTDITGPSLTQLNKEEQESDVALRNDYIAELQTYFTGRAGGKELKDLKEDYKHWYGGFFGCGSDGQTKVETAMEIQSALKEYREPKLTLPQLAAGQEGELGKLVAKILSKGFFTGLNSVQKSKEEHKQVFGGLRGNSLGC